MEDMFSLGSVILWKNIQWGNDGATDGEVADLFVSRVLGSVVLKLKYEDIVYAVSNDDIHPIIFTANTLNGKKYFIYENFRILKRNIEAIKSEWSYPYIKIRVYGNVNSFFMPTMKIRYFFHSLLS